jgi:hypothetical protein
VLFNDSCAEKTVDTCFHIHTGSACAWSHVGRVEKNAYATSKQTPKTIANPKTNAALKQELWQI